MKRIISLCCVALILVSSLAVPASATEISNDLNLIELLDYDTVSAGSNFFAFKGSHTAALTLPYMSNLYYCDILFNCVTGDGLPPSSVTVTWDGVNYVTLTLIDVGNAIYRAYGPVPSGNYTEFKFTINGSAGATYFTTLYSCKVVPVSVDHFDTDSYCHIVSSLYTNLIHYVPSDSINYRYVDASNQEPYECEFTLNLYVTDWQKYDYIDFSLLLSCESITSISASCGDVLLNYDVSEWENSNLDLKDYRIYARLDLTGISRTSTDIPTIIVTGQWSPGWVNLVQVLGASGYITTSLNPITYFLRNIWATLISFSGSVNTWIQTQTTSLVNIISSSFSNLNTWVDNQTSKLEAAIRGDTSSGDQFQDEIQQELDELDQAQVVMDSVTKPAVDQIDVSVDKYVSQADIQVLASPMAVFFEGEIFSKVIIMSILLATVSYVLYGKR